MLKVKAERIEEETINAKLAALSEQDKAQVAILWSDNKDAGFDYLVRQLQRDYSISLTPRALEVLLERMGLVEAEHTPPAEQAATKAATKTAPTDAAGPASNETTSTTARKK